MASSIILKRGSALAAPKLLNKFLTPICSSSLSTRSYNNNASQMMRGYDEDDRRESIDTDRRSDSISRRRDSSPSIFSDVFDPFSPPRSLSQLLNLMDQFTETNPFVNSGASRGLGSGLRRGWDVKEDEDALYLKIDMPGLGKEDVKVSVEQNTLTIKGEGEKESEDEESGRRYSSRIDLPPKLYKLDQVKADMKNGVLRVLVPKVKEEERKDVFQVKVE